MGLRNITATKNDDGTVTLVREKYNPGKYTVPENDREQFRGAQQVGDGESTQELLDLHDGPFVSYRVLDRYEKDGKKWVLLQHTFFEFAIEVEDRPQVNQKVGVPEIRYVEPERAYQLALEYDKTRPQKVIYE